MSKKLLLSAALLLAACPSTEEVVPEPTPNPLEAVASTGSFDLPCLDAAVHVVRTEHDHPHIYGETEKDVACAQGFITARDRFFQMDLISRNGLGRLGELLGDAGLESDIEIRSRGSRWIAEQMVEHASADSTAQWTAYAEGVNAYLDAVRAGEFPPPAELDAVYLLLGLDSPIELLENWDILSVAGVASTVNFTAGYETTDLGWQRTADQLEAWGLDLPEGELRNAGAIHDLWNNIAPVYPVASAPGFGDEERDLSGPSRLIKGAKIEAGTLDRAIETVEDWGENLWRTKEAGFGSNAWAVAPEMTADGDALLAGDGHLSLTIPSFLYNTHLDTQLLGGGDLHMLGLTVAGAPMIGLGTNGFVAWSHTSQTSDINDYYAESVELGDAGELLGTWFQDELIPMDEVLETYEVSDALGSVPGDRTIGRWLTGQGRPIFSIEGTPADSGDEPGAINVFGRWIVPGDVDGDGTVSAISGAASHFGETNFIDGVRGWAKATDVDEWYRAHQLIASYSQHFLVADTSGNIFYSPWEAMPCRGYLPRDAQGLPLDGASPQRLIDGTLYPSFTVTHTDSGHIDPAQDDELTCMLTPEQYPHSKNPEQGYLVNSNNAPWSAAHDQNVWNNDVYVGGPWYGTWRATRIIERLEEDAGNHSVATMESMHGDHRSRMATEFLPYLLDALDLAEAHAADGAVDGTDGRMAAYWSGEQNAAIVEAKGRLEAWSDRSNWAHSGVETFYNAPTDEEMEDAVATMIFNAWMGRFLGSVFNDEGLPGVWRPTGSYGRTRGLKTVLDGVDAAGNANASIDPETGESVFLDDLGTPDFKESGAELAIREFVQALEYLSTTFTVDRTGGFSTTDQSQWLWGLKHFVKFDNFVAREVGDDPLIDSIFEDLGVSPEALPIDDPAPTTGDPRLGMPGFPRPGDAFGIDAAGGISTTDFSYGSGPVMRMAISLGEDGIHGVNVIPGGQSSDPFSAFHHDEARNWLGNETTPIRFYVDDVVANAVGREVLTPAE